MKSKHLCQIQGVVCGKKKEEVVIFFKHFLYNAFIISNCFLAWDYRLLF